MTIYGYARTSTTHQEASLEHQQQVLLSKGVAIGNLRVEEASAVKERPVLDVLLSELKAGDVLAVTTLSRLARSTKHLLAICEDIYAKQAALQILDFGLDTSTAQGKMVLTMLAAVAEFERSLMLERQQVGIAKARQEGKYKGRPSVAPAKRKEVLDLFAKGLKADQVSALSGLGISTCYRIRKDALDP